MASSLSTWQVKPIIASSTIGGGGGDGAFRAARVVKACCDDAGTPAHFSSGLSPLCAPPAAAVCAAPGAAKLRGERERILGGRVAASSIAPALCGGRLCTRRPSGNGGVLLGSPRRLHFVAYGVQRHSRTRVGWHAVRELKEGIHDLVRGAECHPRRVLRLGTLTTILEPHLREHAAGELRQHGRLGISDRAPRRTVRAAHRTSSPESASM
eukprot:scaffold26606_cov124-Isochrysis_galbana.AAC.4